MPPKKSIILSALSLAGLLLAAISGTARHVGLVIVDELRLIEVVLERESRIQLSSLRYERGWFGGTVYFDARIDAEPERMTSLLARFPTVLQDPQGLQILGSLEIRHGPWLGREVGFGAAHAYGRIPFRPFVPGFLPVHEESNATAETVALEFTMQMDWARNLQLTLQGIETSQFPTTARLDIRSRPMHLLVAMDEGYRRFDLHSEGLFRGGALLADWPAYVESLLSGSLIPAAQAGEPPDSFDPPRPQWPPTEPRNPVFGVIQADAAQGTSLRERTLLAGGSFQLTEADGPDCRGHVHPWAPDFMLDSSPTPAGASLELQASPGTVLILRTEAGDWLCDSGNAQYPPQLTLPSAGTGPYALWLGTLEPGPQLARLTVEVKLR